MKLWKKLALGSTAVLAALSLAACSNGSNNSSSSNTNSSQSAKLTMWVNNQQVGYYKQIVKGFTKKYPKIKVRVVQSPNGSPNAKTDVGKDPSKAADVFECPNDQLGQMADAGYINPLSPKDSQWVKDNDVPVAAKAITWKNKIYEFPQVQHAMMLFYNKSKLSASDVKNWDTLTKKGVVACDFTNAYNMWPVMFSAGTTLYGKSGEDLKGSTMNTQNGVNGLKWYAAQKSNKGVMQTTNGLNQLKKGNAQALMDGPWNGNNIKKILGKNFAVTVYPNIKVGGKNVPMQSFLSVAGFAVNAHTKNSKAAMMLAKYVTSGHAQLVAHKNEGEIPVNKKARQTSEITKDPVVDTVIKMGASNRSTIQPKMPEMPTFWNESAPLISGVYDGKIKSSQYKAKLDKLYKDISKKN